MTDDSSNCVPPVIMTSASPRYSYRLAARLFYWESSTFFYPWQSALAGYAALAERSDG